MPCVSRKRPPVSERCSAAPRPSRANGRPRQRSVRPRPHHFHPRPSRHPRSGSESGGRAELLAGDDANGGLRGLLCTRSSTDRVAATSLSTRSRHRSSRICAELVDGRLTSPRWVAALRLAISPRRRSRCLQFASSRVRHFTQSRRASSGSATFRGAHLGAVNPWHHHHFPALHVARPDLHAHRQALALPLEELRARRQVPARVRHPPRTPGVPQRRRDDGAAFAHHPAHCSVAPPDRHHDHLRGCQPGRHHHAHVVAVGHHQSPDQARGDAPRGVPGVLLAPSSLWKVRPNWRAKFWPSMWEVPACSALLSCMSASQA